MMMVEHYAEVGIGWSAWHLVNPDARDLTGSEWLTIASGNEV